VSLAGRVRQHDGQLTTAETLLFEFEHAPQLGVPVLRESLAQGSLCDPDV
jgi:hypothetical protein